MKKIFSAFAAGMLLFSISCNQHQGVSEIKLMNLEKPEENIGGVMANDKEQPVTSDTLGDPGSKQKNTPAFQTSNNNRLIDWDKKIIRHARLSLKVTDYNIYSKNLRIKIKQVGGYISSETQQVSEYKTDDILVIKVPVSQFEEALNMITEGSAKVISKSISTEDVTGTIFDTKARLEAKRNIRLRYLDLLKQAKTMDEILKVQSEINDIQEEMEAAAGRVGYLSHASSFSTIELNCTQVLNPSLKPDETPSFLSEIKVAFVKGAKWSGEFILGLVAIWPLWIIILLAWAAYRKWKLPKTTTA